MCKQNQKYLAEIIISVYGYVNQSAYFSGFVANAVDSLGKAANLSSIRFIKVQTAVFQQAGWMNEVSSEVRGAKDLRK